MKVILVGANSLPPELLKLIMGQAAEMGMETEIQTKEEFKDPSKVVPDFIPHPTQFHAQEQSEQQYWLQRVRMAASSCLALGVKGIILVKQTANTVYYETDNKHYCECSLSSSVQKLQEEALFLEGLLKENIKYPHYVKYIGNEIFMDFYGLCRMYGIKDDTGSLFHAQKKLLNLGKRGDKDYIKDLREGIESLQVHLREKLEEEFNANVVT